MCAPRCRAARRARSHSGHSSCRCRYRTLPVDHPSAGVTQLARPAQGAWQTSLASGGDTVPRRNRPTGHGQQKVTYNAGVSQFDRRAGRPHPRTTSLTARSPSRRALWPVVCRSARGVLAANHSPDTGCRSSPSLIARRAGRRGQLDRRNLVIGSGEKWEAMPSKPWASYW